MENPNIVSALIPPVKLPPKKETTVTFKNVMVFREYSRFSFLEVGPEMESLLISEGKKLYVEDSDGPFEVKDLATGDFIYTEDWEGKVYLIGQIEKMEEG
jgi:hypothetical protein